MITSIERESPVSLYYQLRQAICEQMHVEKMVAGDRLPSVRQLIANYGVSMPVVRQAISGLEQDGIVRVEQGRGTFILKVPPRDGAGDTVASRSVLFVSCSHDANDPYYSRLLHGVQEEAAAHDMQVIYAHPTAARPLKQLLQGHQHMGVILSGVADQDEVDAVIRSERPCVLAGDIVGRQAGSMISTVINDDFEGGYLAGQHLLELGHRDMGCVTGPVTLTFWRQRLDGFRQALMDAGVELREDRVIRIAQEEHDLAAEGAGQLWAVAGDAPSAVFACSDRIAYGVYAALQDRGLRAPADCSVVGCDDLALSSALAPGLTTIHLNIERLGSRAFGILLAQQESADKMGERVVMPVSLIKRGSTAAV